MAQRFSQTPTNPGSEGAPAVQSTPQRPSAAAQYQVPPETESYVSGESRRNSLRRGRTSQLVEEHSNIFLLGSYLILALLAVALVYLVFTTSTGASGGARQQEIDPWTPWGIDTPSVSTCEEIGLALTDFVSGKEVKNLIGDEISKCVKADKKGDRQALIIRTGEIENLAFGKNAYDDAKKSANSLFQKLLEYQNLVQRLQITGKEVEKGESDLEKCENSAQQVGSEIHVSDPNTINYNDRIGKLSEDVQAKQNIIQEYRYKWVAEKANFENLKNRLRTLQENFDKNFLSQTQYFQEVNSQIQRLQHEQKLCKQREVENKQLTLFLKAQRQLQQDLIHTLELSKQNITGLTGVGATSGDNKFTHPRQGIIQQEIDALDQGIARHKEIQRDIDIQITEIQKSVDACNKLETSIKENDEKLKNYDQEKHQQQTEIDHQVHNLETLRDRTEKAEEEYLDQERNLRPQIDALQKEMDDIKYNVQFGSTAEALNKLNLLKAKIYECRVIKSEVLTKRQQFKDQFELVRKHSETLDTLQNDLNQDINSLLKKAAASTQDEQSGKGDDSQGNLNREPAGNLKPNIVLSD